jgi:hypothetical protein
MRQWRNSRCTSTGARLLLHCALLGVLPACHPSGPDPPFDRYLHALGTALALRAPGGQTGRVIPPPPPATMQVSIVADGLAGIDIVTLSGCAAQRTIIRQDTSLGRAAKPSQQLLLALEYLRAAPPCIQQLRDRDDALADRLHNAWLQRQAQLPALIFNATLGGDEFAAFWRARPAPGAFPRVDARETSAALYAIEPLVRRWLRGDYRAHDRDFELWLAAVAGGDGGTLLETLSRRGDTLAAADRLLARNEGAALRCRNTALTRWRAGPTTELRARFQRDVQSQYFRSLERYRRLLHPIARLERQLDAVLPPPYRLWMEGRNQNFVALAAAPRRHLRLLEQLPPVCAKK